MKSNMRNDYLLNAKGVAKALSLSGSKVYQMIDSGELPVIRIGRSKRVHPKDLEDYIQKKRDENKPIK